MQRIATYMAVKPGFEERYVEEHRNIWPEVVDGITRFGIHNYSIFMHGRELYSYFEVKDLQRTSKLAAADPDNQRWQKHMADFFDTGPGIQDGSTVYPVELFHTGGYTGQMEIVHRVGRLMQLKAGMEQIYQEELRSDWPEILAGIARAKIRNYSIFLIGRVLFSYFQVNDLDKALATLATDPENRSWQAHLAPMFDIGPGNREGTSLFLEEVFHII
ncbi:MAG TPA: L-rhamnose mutarotase [candidate division Zixibacteria bacterium]|nr:L-rhamnose mutarotase [candidate division Zixibacteria bacterium]